MTAKTRVAAYFRTSVATKAQPDLSLAVQRHDVMAYCLDRGFELIDEFADVGAPGTGKVPSQFQLLLEKALGEDHPYDLVVVQSQSRLSRDVVALTETVHRLQQAGVDFVAIQ